MKNILLYSDSDMTPGVACLAQESGGFQIYLANVTDKSRMSECGRHLSGDEVIVEEIGVEALKRLRMDGVILDAIILIDPSHSKGSLYMQELRSEAELDPEVAVEESVARQGFPKVSIIPKSLADLDRADRLGEELNRPIQKFRAKERARFDRMKSFAEGELAGNPLLDEGVRFVEEVCQLPQGQRKIPVIVDGVSPNKINEYERTNADSVLGTLPYSDAHERWEQILRSIEGREI